jgi:hypothetical protein
LDNLTEMLKGVLEGCVLEIIGRGETYGYEITRRLNALGFADVVEGTVYTYSSDWKRTNSWTSTKSLRAGPAAQVLLAQRSGAQGTEGVLEKMGICVRKDRATQGGSIIMWIR